MILAGLAAVVVFLRLAVVTGRTDDAANDARWAELTGTPVADRQPTGPLAGLLAGARRMSERSGWLRRPQPVPVEQAGRER